MYDDGTIPANCLNNHLGVLFDVIDKKEIFLKGRRVNKFTQLKFD